MGFWLPGLSQDKKVTFLQMTFSNHVNFCTFTEVLIKEIIPRDPINKLCFTWLQWVNSFWPGDAIWCQRSGSTLVRVMACCQMAPRNYLHLSLCWLIFNIFFCIGMTTISQESFKIPIDKLILKLTFLQLQPQLSSDNEFMWVVTTKLSNRFLL